jgi:chromosome segregation ATPase
MAAAARTAQELAFDKITAAVYKARLSRIQAKLVEVEGMIARTSPHYLWAADDVERMGDIVDELHEKRENIFEEIQTLRKRIRRLDLKIYAAVERNAEMAAKVRKYEAEHVVELGGFWARTSAADD